MTRSQRTSSKPGRKSKLPTLVDADTVAHTLDVPARHVRRLVDERRIPFVKVGKYVRFDVEELAIWIEVNRKRQCQPASARDVGL